MKREHSSTFIYKHTYTYIIIYILLFRRKVQKCCIGWPLACLRRRKKVMAVVESNIYKYKKAYACMTDKSWNETKIQEIHAPKRWICFSLSTCSLIWSSLGNIIQSLASILNSKYIYAFSNQENLKTNVQTVSDSFNICSFSDIRSESRSPKQLWSTSLHWIYPCQMPFHVQNKTREPFFFHKISFNAFSWKYPSIYLLLL